MARTVSDIPATPHFDFIFGTFELSTWRIPYFSTTISLKHAADSLRLATDFPGAERIHWKIDELYQRDIDWPRVERKIVPYLNAADRPQFFNSLTIALLPMRDAALRETFSGENSWVPPQLERPSRFGKIFSVGPLSCGYWDSWESIEDAEARTGQLRWNPDQVFSVALDGQHRLAAIQRLVELRSVPSERLQRTRVPIILLILDEQLGYHAPSQSSLVEVLRVVFMDLNKHARIVPRARQILLDDTDPNCVCVRAVLGEELTDGTTELDAACPRLPLSLVDWHTEQAKFDEGPYLATVLGLDWMASTLLAAKPLNDPTDYPRARRQIRALRNALGIDIQTASDRVVELEEYKLRPFTYTDDELDEIRSAFLAVWNQPMIHLLTKLSPYCDLLDKRAATSTLTVEFANWYHLYYRKSKDRFEGRASTDYLQFVGRLRTRQENPITKERLEEALASIEAYKKNNLAFNVVFQRAYILGFAEFIKITDTNLEEIDSEEDEIPDFDEDADGEVDEDEDFEDSQDDSSGTKTDELARHNSKRAEQYVAALNSLVAEVPEVLSADCEFEDEGGNVHRFWQGTLRKPEGGIDFTLGASKRASELFFLTAAMHVYDSIVDPEQESQFDDFWTDVNPAQAGETGVARRIIRAVKRYSEKETSAGGRILRAKEQDYAPEASREEARIRMAWLWSKMGL